MFGLVLVLGNVIDRLGHLRALLGGLLLLGFSALMAVWRSRACLRRQQRSSESGRTGTSPTSPPQPSWPIGLCRSSGERYSASPTYAQRFWRDFGFSRGPYPGNSWTRRTWCSEGRRSCSSEPLNPESSLETYRIPLTTPQRTPHLF